ncbi:uncharacterized protein BO88DRAFT_212341 [Aspergillus vadensis CBS 113365]|uniref:Uncharacterized protein n=1 Tax=Aspergillus vadensis (strain CBS 113365 / IMI 142717 / IBT 24658) TaxID=1448311 RepID=A0A319BJB0_ASPVC|nr:hypothetical protein BO88DRAFT_212341 [Aspergillus vadensis CBS 113365]PYH72381.1 hypothetical protein BO88DRAFT_212341 [Aspergillus vadensis CBS 113365]
MWLSSLRVVNVDSLFSSQPQGAFALSLVFSLSLSLSLSLSSSLLTHSLTLTSLGTLNFWRFLRVIVSDQASQDQSLVSWAFSIFILFILFLLSPLTTQYFARCSLSHPRSP